ncbi:OTU protein [Oleoguttula sp. CCFEE 5521]
MEELQARHRKEQRDLQSCVTQKKKQASKKTRKGVNDECEQLEAALAAHQAREIAELYGEPIDDPSEDLAKLDVNGDDAVPIANGADLERPTPDLAPKLTNGMEDHESGTRKPNRQKARLARRAAEQDALAEQAAREAQNLPDMKKQERYRMLASMKERNLVEKEIRADGHCLYSAVADQLQLLDVPIGTIPGATADLQPYKVTRMAAADYMAKHPDDFAPFLEEPMGEYLHKVRDTAEWGGQLELLALAKTYGVEIHVLQGFGRVEKIESGAGGENIREVWLGYYKHGFGLGEHYNSLRKKGA